MSAFPRCAVRSAGRAAGLSASPLIGGDHDKYRREFRRRGIAPEIARRQTQHGSGLGRARWVVERTFAWLRHFKRLLVRYDRHHEIHEAFLAIGCCLVCFPRLSHSL